MTILCEAPPLNRAHKKTFFVPADLPGEVKHHPCEGEDPSIALVWSSSIGCRRCSQPSTILRLTTSFIAIENWTEVLHAGPWCFYSFTCRILEHSCGKLRRRQYIQSPQRLSRKSPACATNVRLAPEYRTANSRDRLRPTSLDDALILRERGDAA